VQTYWSVSIFIAAYLQDFFSLGWVTGVDIATWLLLYVKHLYDDRYRVYLC
jgi:hypothetical protein